MESNFVGFLNIIEACRHYEIDGLIYATNSSKQENMYLEKLLEEGLLPVELIHKRTRKTFKELEQIRILKEVDLGKKLVRKIIERINY